MWIGNATQDANVSANWKSFPYHFPLLLQVPQAGCWVICRWRRTSFFQYITSSDNLWGNFYGGHVNKKFEVILHHKLLLIWMGALSKQLNTESCFAHARSWRRFLKKLEQRRELLCTKNKNNDLFLKYCCTVVIALSRYSFSLCQSGRAKKLRFTLISLLLNACWVFMSYVLFQRQPYLLQ